jgi:hypothetical protein
MTAKWPPRIIYNDDSCTLRTAPPPHSVESLAIALDYLKGTQVDCLCWCVGEQLAYAWPSKVIENIFELKERGVNMFSIWENNRDIMYSLWREGIDYLPMLIERAHKQGLTFIASYRMNDTHIKSYPDSALAPDWWRTHQHYRIWDATDGKSYYNAAVDYSFPEVRNRYRNALMEIADWYYVDGLELDFTRSPYFFAPSEAWDKRHILTRFVRDIGKGLEERGRKRGRPYTLILRLACLPRALQMAGVDLERWIKERLAPIFVLSELVNNFNQDLEPWKTRCQEAGVLLYPAVEAGPAFNVTDFTNPYVRNPLAPRHDGSGGVRFELEDDLGMQRAAAQNFLAQEPDGIAMFNFPCRLAEGLNIMHDDEGTFRKTVAVLREMGSLKTLARQDKHYTFYKELPIYVESSRPRQYHQTIPFAIRGKDIRQGTVTLRWRQIAEKNPHADGVFRQDPIVKPGWMKTYLNGREVPEAELKKARAPGGRIPSGFKLKSHEIVELTVPGREIKDGENTLAFEIPRFPAPRDPYIYIYDLAADVRFGKDGG